MTSMPRTCLGCSCTGHEPPRTCVNLPSLQTQQRRTPTPPSRPGPMAALLARLTISFSAFLSASLNTEPICSKKVLLVHPSPSWTVRLEHRQLASVSLLWPPWLTAQGLERQASGLVDGRCESMPQR